MGDLEQAAPDGGYGGRTRGRFEASDAGRRRDAARVGDLEQRRRTGARDPARRRLRDVD